MYKSMTLSNALVAFLVCPWSATSAFQSSQPVYGMRPSLDVAIRHSSIPSAAQERYASPTKLHVVAERPMEKEDEKRKKRKNGGDSGAWIERNGGFLPNLPGRITRTPPPLEVTDVYQYKQEVVDVDDRIVCVRFYAPWCRACKAVEGKFRRLSKEFPDVKFVEVPVTKENARLHQALQVPSLPFAHIYEPSVGLVEEQKINKNVFADFKEILKHYVDGECGVEYDDDGSSNHAN